MNKRKILLTLAIFFLVLGIGSYLKTQAGVGNNGSGWLWDASEDANIGGRVCTLGVDATDPACKDGNESGVGWISMNSTNCDSDGNGLSDATKYPCTAGQTVANYGINVPTGDGYITGYAWSENIGWIDFDPQNHCTTGTPAVGQYQAASCTPPVGSGCSVGVSIVGTPTSSLTGCARIVGIAQESLSGNSGGWEGWLKMSGTGYGVTFDRGTKQFLGYAWNGEEAGSGSNMAGGLGWVDFKKAKTEVVNLIKICSACDNSSDDLTSLSFSSAGEKKKVKACKVTSDDLHCAGTDVTDSANCTWNSDNTGTVTVVKDTVNHVAEITSVATGSTNVNAAYTEASKTYNDSVNAVVCIKSGCSADCSNTCTSANCADNCGYMTCNGTKTCTAPYKEIQPQ
jgi:hypothetical protein